MRKYIKLFEKFKSEESIIRKCKYYGISNYTINADGSIDVEGDLNLSYCELDALPLNFNKISGSFYCKNNMLLSLEGAPKEVGGDFFCNNNDLTSLEYSPVKVYGSFNAGFNYIESLKGCPSFIGGDFNISKNKDISTFEDYPDYVGGSFYANARLEVLLALFNNDLNLIHTFNDYNLIKKVENGNYFEVLIKLSRLNKFLIDNGFNECDEDDIRVLSSKNKLV